MSQLVPAGCSSLRPRAKLQLCGLRLHGFLGASGTLCNFVQSSRWSFHNKAEALKPTARARGQVVRASFQNPLEGPDGKIDQKKAFRNLDFFWGVSKGAPHALGASGR